ncbi:winged helix-turn-helix domain-containing protein [Actinoallomurus rhizosphaericola]|uniref:winged helix-turn-helix domain-containing protein n=1 Tax=Actinoallomurus rhizosphaericola TaxID=2952536 RepID=UPI003873B415
MESTSREVTVLEYLMRQRGRVVSKAELLEHCWDSAYDGGLAAVEVHIHLQACQAERCSVYSKSERRSGTDCASSPQIIPPTGEDPS